MQCNVMCSVVRCDVEWNVRCTAIRRDDFTAGAAASEELQEGQRGYANVARFTTRAATHTMRRRVACPIDAPPPPVPTLPQACAVTM